MSSTSTHCAIDVKDWKYLAEGGKHVIFSYHGKDEMFHGKILRVCKDTLWSGTQLFTYNCYVSHFDAIKRCLQGGLDNSQGGNYFDDTRFLNVDRKKIESMALKVLESNVIPQGRKSDWRLRMGIKDCHSSPVLLMPNYRFFPNSISIEIKPKGGYLATSPLVNSSNTCKYKFSRFQILQELSYRGIISKGWMKGPNLIHKSEYDPLDLFSGNFERIRKSICALFSCPQNNLKVCDGAYMLFGDRCAARSANIFSATDDCLLFIKALEIVSDIGIDPSTQPEQGQLRDMLQDELVHVISNILFQDAFLQLLATSQKEMDVLDADGAIIVYERLVDLCHGSTDMAEKLIDADYNFGSFRTNRTSKMDDFCDYLKEHSTPEQFSQDRYNRGMNLIQTLTKEDCTELLQKWLLSLALCDLSFFIIISKSPSDLQCNDSRTIRTSTGRLVEYVLKVIDYDRKPAKKLRNRKQLEDKFACFYSSSNAKLHNIQRTSIYD